MIRIILFSLLTLMVAAPATAKNWGNVAKFTLTSATSSASPLLQIANVEGNKGSSSGDDDPIVPPN